MPCRPGIGTFVVDDIELTGGGLDYFTLPPVDTVLEEGRFHIIRPSNAITNEGPYEFNIAPDNDHFIYLPLTRLHGKIDVHTKEDDKPIGENVCCGAVNLFTQSIFKQIEIELNGTPVNDLSTGTYAYKSYIESLLSYGDDAKKTLLAQAMYLDDTLQHENSLKPTENLALALRSNQLIKGFYFTNLIHADFFQMERYLLPNMHVKLCFIRNADSFSFITDTEKFKIVLSDLYLTIRKIKVRKDFHASILSNLQKEPALFPLTQSKIKTFLINSGTSSINLHNITTGIIPKSMIVGFVSSKGYNGAVNKNPFLFSSFNLSYLQLLVNSEPFYSTPLKPDFTTGKFTREYQLLLDNTGVLHHDCAFSITALKFKFNSCFFVFDFSPDSCNGFHNHETKKALCDLELVFKEEVSENVQVIVYSSYRQLMQIDANFNVKLLE
jgi:hypothetical protein